uniref:AT-hook motif nuclear-localized protein n=1 Tax=Kalanchoe fedtschenkoi TaxID=63787 RepID=A0A7N0U5B8_KALFE
MDSRDASIQGRQPPQGRMMTNPFGFAQHLPNNPVMMAAPNSGMPNPNFSFNPMSAPKPFDAGLLGHHHHQQQNGSPAAAAAPSGSEQGKKKRGRPRKYSPDGIGLGLSSNSQAASFAAGGGSGAGVKNDLGDVNAEGSQEKKQRGRPPGSGKKQLDALGGPGGVGFTPHVIMISAGENIVSKMTEFSQEGPRTICILSANGTVSKVSLRQPASAAGIISHEGPFEIISLSGTFCCVNIDGSHNDEVKLTVSLASSDGRILGGGIAGELIAETAVQIVAGSFIPDRKKSNANAPVASPVPIPASRTSAFGGSGSAAHVPVASPIRIPASRMSAFAGSGPGTTHSPTQLDAASDSSDDSGGGGHSLNHTPGSYSNANHPMQGIQMYQPHMGWGSSGVGGMHHNR